MKRRSIFIAAAIIAPVMVISVLWITNHQAAPELVDKRTQSEKQNMAASTITSEIDTFIAAQNAARGGPVTGGGTLPFDYDALSGTVPTGGNSVTGIAGITAGAAPIILPTSQPGNAVIIDGGISTAASTSGPDSYSLLVDTSGNVTLTDNNTSQSQIVTGANYLVFDGGAQNPNGSYQSIYFIESGTNAQVAAMYNAAFQRQPDLPGLEFYAKPIANGSMTLHQAADYFLASPEFAKDYPALTAPADNGGPNDQAFITELYGQILHRTPTGSEVTYYVDALQGTLTNASGQHIPACDRAQLLIYFSVSPENQSDISSWLINPANGAVSLGAMPTQVANTDLATEVASGTINTADFANVPQTAIIGGNGVNINGMYSQGLNNPNAPQIYVGQSGLTIDLSAQYYDAMVAASNVTVNGVATGGSEIDVWNTPSVMSGAGLVPAMAGSGTVNLFGNDNWIDIYGKATAAATTVVNGWNSTDVFSGLNSSVPGPQAGHSFATLMAENDGIVYQGNPGSPINGATLGAQNSGSWFGGHQIAINVGAIADDSASTMVVAANQVYKVGDVGTVNQPSSETAFFFGQDPQGNTMVYYWHGDSAHAGTISASDLTGAVELVGIHASSLISANFHK